MKDFGEQYKSTNTFNKITKPLKEKITNKACHVHSQSNISEAAKYF